MNLPSADKFKIDVKINTAVTEQCKYFELSNPNILYKYSGLQKTKQDIKNEASKYSIDIPNIKYRFFLKKRRENVSIRL